MYALILCRRGFPVGALRFAQPSDDWPEPPRFLRRLWGTFHENAHQRLAACDALCRTRAYEPVARHFIEGFRKLAQLVWSGDGYLEVREAS